MKINKSKKTSTLLLATLLFSSANLFADDGANKHIPYQKAAISAKIDNKKFHGAKDAKSLKSLMAQYKRPSSIPYPDNNKFSQEKVALGKSLFFDPRISSSGVISCSTCHNPSFSWGEWQSKGVGDQHKQLGRKDPTVLNLAWDELYFWDGRASSLEQQALGPIESTHEMNMPLDKMITTLKTIKGYEPMFKASFPADKDPISKENVAMAIATFERGIVSDEAPFDKWLAGNEKAISESAKRGFVIFNEKANCSACHSGWKFSDGSFQDIGLHDADVGRGAIVKIPAMQHAFKTVGLRDIERRGPYMHDGSLNTLEEVVDHYDHGFVKRDSLSDSIKPLNLTSDEKADLVEFLKTLTSMNPKPVTLPVLPK